MQRHGVATCAKHFPGLGAVPKDPHTHLPTVDLDWVAMRTTHLVPFIAAIEAGVATIMSSHVCYPRLDALPLTPATFSSRLVRDLLRRELGFHGVVLSDDLEMGALRQLCQIGEAAVRAVEAGHDIVLVCSDLVSQREAFEALRAAYREGRLSLKELERSAERIERLRHTII
jgi:beta-N-acetylhexosaminidase